MSRYIPVFALVTAVACAPATDRALSDAERAAIADTVRQLAAALYEAQNRRDASVFIGQTSEAPEFRYASTGNLFPSRDSLSKAAYARVGSLRELTYTLRDGSVAVLARDAAVFTGSYDETAVDSTGKTLNFRDAWTAVYVRRDGQWRILHGHFSRTPAPATR